ncbi:type II and III secretion system protein family protein [Roseixanthobacter liquoris]|uniref:type II and III secretion system protein family protein n=1 Tax=Roseixanthobacter liquoris TaxID=3119921 RepID=UPI00372661DD
MRALIVPLVEGPGRIIRLGCLALFWTLALAGSGQAQEQLVQFANGRSTASITVPAGQFLTAKTVGDVDKVVVGDPAVATAVPLTSRTFYVLGKSLGRTNIAVFGPGGTLLGTVDVEVGADTADLGSALREAIPAARIKVDTINGRIRLSGTVPDAVSLQKVLEIAQQYGAAGVINALRVTGGQQVMLEVRIIEVNRNAGRELGISWFVGGKSGGAATGAFSPPELPPPGVQFHASLPSGSSPFGTVLAQVLGGGISADVLIQALEEKGLARRLAEPNLVALSGETASFLAGGEVPIPVSEENGSVTVQYKEYGIRLNFTPIVLERGLINMKLQPEVSQVDESTRVTTGAISVPSFITRRASTILEVRDGQSFAMAGLLQTTHSNTQSQLPWVGQLPVLGALFRSSSFQEDETDLVIIVTPRLVSPARPGLPLRTPLDTKLPGNDVDFFLMGKLEVDDDMMRRFADGTGVIGPYGHIIDIGPPKPGNASKVIAKY